MVRGLLASRNINRQREYFIRGTFGLRQGAGGKRGVGVRRLQMQRYWIVHRCAYPGVCECVPKTITLPVRNSDGVRVIDVLHAWEFAWSDDISVGQQYVVLTCDSAPSFSPLLQVAKLDRENRALNTFHPVVERAQCVVILAILARPRNSFNCVQSRHRWL